MIIGIGCDIVEHGITQKLEWQSDKEMLVRIFSQKELDLYNKQKTVKFISGRFAAKEAVLKCIGSGMYDGVSLTDIQIVQSKNGKPIVELKGEVKKISDKMQINFWHISITHSISYSYAFVIAEGCES